VSKIPIIRAIVPEDLPPLKGIIDATGLFPSEMLDDMIADYFNGNPGAEIWLTAGDSPVAIVYCAPETLTQGTWNMLLLAVHPDAQRQGVGRRVARHLEDLLAGSGERMLLVETSGLPEFEATRAFYRACGYAEEARIRDYYQQGEDKIVFRKMLVQPSPNA
jgi:ribosomal protein S18 acetylase RimI-like enzyme